MFSFTGDTVVDPFLGTGTTAVAAIETGRNSIGVEVVPRYVELTAERLGQLGLSAKVEIQDEAQDIRAPRGPELKRKRA
jgi:DNA modification methylase